MVSLLSGIRVTKSLVLAGGQGTSLTPLTKYRPTSMVPILGRPLLEHTIASLTAAGMTDLVIAGSKGIHSAFYRNYFKTTADSSPSVRYIEDDRPRGTAGVLRDFRAEIGSDPFLVVSGNCFLGNINLDEVLDFHISKHAALTVVVNRTPQFSLEGIRCSADGMIEDIVRDHSSRRRSTIETLGVYVVDPGVLDYIDTRSYFDLKEQLIPALRKASRPVYAYEAKQFCRSLYTIKDYFDLHRSLLLQNPEHYAARLGLTMLSDGVWIGKNVTISPKAYILGPAIINNDAVIEANTQIIGPAVLGERCSVEKGAFVRESILWDDAVMEAGARVQYSIMQQGMRATSSQLFSNTVIVDEAEAEDVSLMTSDHLFHGITAMRPSGQNGQRRALFPFLKRTIDILVSLAGLVAILPILLVIAVAIKLDSPGPVLFRQRRSGRGGKDFNMLKFRTMVQGAEKLQQKLAARTETDGPMFKISRDPRITRIGAFLRGSSLDELPQLINVLRGEMSLVGPRPLIMDEMKCSPSWRDTRLRVKPGMTGLWQVSGRSDAMFHDWIRYDVHYVMNQSLWLDVKILAQTVKVVLKKVGAY